MKIKLTDSDGKLFATVTSWENANIAAKAIFKLHKYSDLYYHLFFDDGNDIAGSIDLEPHSFHQPHQKTILTSHLKTFWGNVSRITPNEYGWLRGFTQQDIDECKTLLTYLPETAKAI